MEGHQATTTNNITPMMSKKPTSDSNSHHKKNDTVDGSSHSHILQDVSEASPLTDKNHDHDQRDLESATKLETNNKQQQLQQSQQQHQSSGELFMSTYFSAEVFILHKIQIN